MLASGPSHWHGGRCQLVWCIVKALLLSCGHIGDEVWKGDCRLSPLTVVRSPVSLARKTAVRGNQA